MRPLPSDNNAEYGIQELFCKISSYNPREYNMMDEEDVEVRSFKLPEHGKEFILYVNRESKGSFNNSQTANDAAFNHILKRKREGWVVLSRSSNVRKRLAEK